MLVQECGRIGRDGLQCICYILYKGFLNSQCNGKMKGLINSKNCRRQFISNMFTASKVVCPSTGCLCCDNCAHACECSNPVELIKFDKENDEVLCPSTSRKREVTDVQLQVLKEKLVRYRTSLLPKSVSEFIPVGTLNIFFEFGFYQIEQILKNCHQLFTIEDILSRTELWRHVHANNVYKILYETFKDISKLSEDIQLPEEEFRDLEIVADEWKDIRDDSTLCNFTMDISADDSMNTCNTSGDNTSIEGATGNNVSEIFTNIANSVDMDLRNS